MAWWRFYWSKPHAPIPINTDIECSSSNQFIVLVPRWACRKMAGDDKGSQNTTHSWPLLTTPVSTRGPWPLRGQGELWWGKLQTIDPTADPHVYLTLTLDILFILFDLCTFILHSECMLCITIFYCYIVPFKWPGKMLTCRDIYLI